jgi:hypothetical protein
VIGVVVIGLAVGLPLALLSGSSAPPPSPSSAPISPAAQQLLRSALAGATRAGSFHYVSTFTSQASTQSTIGDAGPNSGKQVITIDTHTFTVLVIGSACYFQGDTNSMVDQLGVSAATASTHAGQWISLAPTDSPYGSVYAAVTAPAALSDNIAFKPQQDLGTSIAHGRRVHGIAGAMTDVSANGQTLHAQGIAHLEVRAARSHLPVRYSERGTINGQRTDFVMAFSRWGEPVNISAPPGAVAWSSLGGGNTLGPPGGSPTIV